MAREKKRWLDLVKTLTEYTPEQIIESTIGMTQDELQKVIDFINNGCK